MVMQNNNYNDDSNYDNNNNNKSKNNKIIYNNNFLLPILFLHLHYRYILVVSCYFKVIQVISFKNHHKV